MYKQATLNKQQIAKLIDAHNMFLDLSMNVTTEWGRDMCQMNLDILDVMIEVEMGRLEVYLS